MDKRGLVILIVIIAIIFFAAGFLVQRSGDKTKAPIVKQNDNECAVDSDCVRSTCCHASSCVPKGQAPECSGLFCTQECVQGTLDCGQGSCSCLEGNCKAVIK